ncbi:hypothetical protein COU59_00340 [Candidatus Pacearchaeota archaeon CG10_big_fil_rev_8_21_14_0_10_34_12]|nr:MAG: hypothetical protein COU59_00340 [Candidatus Pacearchaeota archaeon CG10_big_fil_rev_8_21_14_0_10_34_12]
MLSDKVSNIPYIQNKVDNFGKYSSEKKHIIILTVFGGVLAGVSGLGIYEQIQRGKIHNEIERQADTNHNGITTAEEWIEFYRKVGINPDNHIKSKKGLNPRIDLSQNHLEYYLGKTKQKPL